MRNKFIETRVQDGVLKAMLNRDVTNAIDLALVSELRDVIGKARNDPGITCFILGSANSKFFSIGFDIPQLFRLSRKDFRNFYHAFNQLCIDLYSLPKPTITAIPGHAVAGGCILTLCCDYRYIAEGKKKMGLNEIKLGVPVPYPSDCILRQVVGFRHAREITDSGEFYLPEEALRMGLVDRILPEDQLFHQAEEKVRLMGAYPPKGFAMIKQNRVEPVVFQIKEKLEEKEAYFLECWYAEETRGRLREAMEKF